MHKIEITEDKPHPRSYNPDIPLNHDREGSTTGHSRVLSGTKQRAFEITEEFRGK